MTLEEKREIARVRASRWYYANRERALASMRTRYAIKYNDIKEATRRYEKRNPHKRKAYKLVAKAIKQGSLIKIPCEVCGESKVEAHHEDYSKPLDVRWLCRKHHKEVHRVNLYNRHGEDNGS